MKVLLHVNYFEGAGKFETLFKLIRVCGANGVELRATTYYDMGKEKYRALVEELKQQDPDIELAFGFPHDANADEEARKKNLDDFVEFLDWAHDKCGTRLLNMYTGSMVAPDATYFEFHKNGSALANEETYARHGAYLTLAGKELEKRNMLAALESHNCYLHDTAKSCAKLMTYVKSPAVGINYDHGNIILNRNGESIDEVFTLLKGKIYYAHLKNLLMTQDRQYVCTHLDGGMIDTYKVMKGLKNELKSGMFAIEYSCSGDGIIAAVRDMEYVRLLREWLNI